MKGTINILAALLLTIAAGCRSTGKPKGFQYNFPPEIAPECWGARNNAIACVERVTGRTITEQGRSLTVYKQAGERLINGRWAWTHNGIKVSGLFDEPRAGEYAIIIGVCPDNGTLGPQSTVDLQHEMTHLASVWAGLGRGHPAELKPCARNWRDPR